jgi:hypothetical protein
LVGGAYGITQSAMGIYMPSDGLMVDLIRHFYLQLTFKRQASREEIPSDWRNLSQLA